MYRTRISLVVYIKGGEYIAPSFSNEIGINTPDGTPASIFEIQDNDSGLNSVGSDVVLTINNASSTAFDPYIDFQTASTTRWLVGVDDSASNDPFRIATSTATFNDGSIFSITRDGTLTVKSLVVTEEFTLEVPDVLDVHATTTQSFPNGSFEAIIFDVVDVALGDMSFTAGNSSTTIPHTDNYRIFFEGIVDKTGGGTEIAQVMLFINNTEHPECYSEASIASNTISVPINFVCIESLTINDVLTVKAKADGADTQFAALGTGVTGDIAIATWIVERIQ